MHPNPLIDSRPKVNSLLRTESNATGYLNLHKFEIEKQRLERELDTIEQRRCRLQKRLAFLNSQVLELQSQSKKASPHLVAVERESAPDAIALNTLFLEV
jgi:predicted  nucleic acid-binding Zn-ribbon protein